jgi:diguanylate cyclase (GGDEF)-like protein
MPIKARNEFFGLLHIQWGPPPTGVGAELLAKQLAVKKDLASTVTHQFSLALANLKLRDQLQAQSIKDQLTGLYNRRHMEASLIREAHRAKRHEKPMGVIMLDVDHFKKFNDTHGHEEGDELLRKLGALLKAAVRQEDIVCRYGGEEFLIIMPEAPVEIAVQRGRQLRDKVRGQLLVKGQPVTISVGVAIFPAHGATPESVIAAADSALYQAKDAGRDQVVVFKPKV